MCANQRIKIIGAGVAAALAVFVIGTTFATRAHATEAQEVQQVCAQAIDSGTHLAMVYAELHGSINDTQAVSLSKAITAASATMVKGTSLEGSEGTIAAIIYSVPELLVQGTQEYGMQLDTVQTILQDSCVRSLKS